jgi:hypothetical protein
LKMSGKVLVIGLALVLAVSTSLGIFPWDQIEEIIGAKIELEERLEAVTKKSCSLSENVRWEEIKAAGFILTEKSWEAFAQICERLVFEFWDFKVYVDLEARVMWTYADPTNPDSEIYYVQFAD